MCENSERGRIGVIERGKRSRKIFFTLDSIVPI